MFKDERSRPFFDLLDLVRPKPDMTAIDLGCGTGTFTALFHERFRCASTLGVDNSPNMLEKAPKLDGLSFLLEDVELFAPDTPVDVVISNSLIHWIPDHARMLARIKAMLRPAAQLVIQFPNNGSHTYQQLAYELEKEPPFDQFPPNPIDENLLTLEQYAKAMDDLGMREIDVHLRVYLHHLNRGDQILEWAKGTFLTHYAKVHSPEVHAQFMTEYRRRLFDAIPADQPYLFTFRRVFLSAFTA